MTMRAKANGFSFLNPVTVTFDSVEASEGNYAYGFIEDSACRSRSKLTFYKTETVTRKNRIGELI